MSEHLYLLCYMLFVGTLTSPFSTGSIFYFCIISSILLIYLQEGIRKVKEGFTIFQEIRKNVTERKIFFFPTPSPPTNRFIWGDFSDTQVFHCRLLKFSIFFFE